MTEQEVLERVKSFIGEASMAHGSHISFGEGDDFETWMVMGESAVCIFPSRRQERLNRPPSRWEIEARDRRGSVTVGLFNDTPHDMPERLCDAIAWLQDFLDQVPKKFQRTAEVSFGTRYEYGESYTDLEIKYTRPETDEEWATRREELDERIRRQEQRARADYERLKKAFEPSA